MNIQVVPKKLHGKWAKLRQSAAEREFPQVAPSESDLLSATFVPRRAGVAATQIEGMFCARCHAAPLEIQQDSRNEIGTDHERVTGVMVMKGRRVVENKTAAGGPRRVLSAPSSQTVIDDQVLNQLAKQHTGPASLGPKFKMSTEAKRFRGVAKRDKSGLEILLDTTQEREERMESTEGREGSLGLERL